MNKNNSAITYVITEFEGLIKTGGLADVGRMLPLSLQQLGLSVSVILPRYKCLVERGNAQLVLSTTLDCHPHVSYEVYKSHHDGVNIFAIHHDGYFASRGLYGDGYEAYSDNAERFAFYCTACLDMLPKLKLQTDILHINDWHTALIPYLLKTHYAHNTFYQGIKSLLTVHNGFFQGQFECKENPFLQQLPHWQTHINFLMQGILYADMINAVSEHYAKELLTDLGGHGLGECYRQRHKNLCGILNGCDYRDWDAKKDPFLSHHYADNRRSLALGKKNCKLSLQKRLGLPQDSQIPMYGMVCRITKQKGLQYLIPIIAELSKYKIQIVLLGTGDPQLTSQLEYLAREYEQHFVFINQYENSLAHQITAAADFFLMPSEFEPCGLNQMYSMAYGTIPIVRAVGGLLDTVQDIESVAEDATGFVFEQPSAQALLNEIQHSLICYYQDRDALYRMSLNAMKKKYTWDRAALAYVAVYERMRSYSRTGKEEVVA